MVCAVKAVVGRCCNQLLGFCRNLWFLLTSNLPRFTKQISEYKPDESAAKMSAGIALEMNVEIIHCVHMTKRMDSLWV